MSLSVNTLNLGMMGTNCYILLDENKNAAVIDPEIYNSSLEKIIKDMGITELKYILLTHGHFDHIGGVKELREKFGGKIVIHEEDEKCFVDETYYLTSFFSQNTEYPEKADITVKDGDILPFGNREIEVIHTPGHTEGGVCYKTDNLIFSGDTLFENSIGRSDFPGGNPLVLLKSVRKLVSRDGSFYVLPGHGGSTTLEKERKTNPFLQNG